MRCFVLTFILGTLLLQRCAELPQHDFAWLLAAVALAWWLARARPWPRALLLLAAGALAGFHYAAWRAEAVMAQSLPPAWEIGRASCRERV